MHTAEEDSDSEEDTVPIKVPLKCSKGKKLKRGGGDPPKRPPSRERQAKELRKKARDLKAEEMFTVLNHPFLQTRVDVNIFLIHITVGLVDFEVFTSNLATLCAALHSSPSSLSSVIFPINNSSLDGRMKSMEASQEAMNVKRAQNLGCLTSFNSLMSKLILSLKVMK